MDVKKAAPKPANPYANPKAMRGRGAARGGNYFIYVLVVWYNLFIYFLVSSWENYINFKNRKYCSSVGKC